MPSSAAMSRTKEGRYFGPYRYVECNGQLYLLHRMYEEKLKQFARDTALAEYWLQVFSYSVCTENSN